MSTGQILDWLRGSASGQPGGNVAAGEPVPPGPAPSATTAVPGPSMPLPTWYVPPAAQSQAPSADAGTAPPAAAVAPEGPRQREFVEVEKPNARLRALELAMDEFAKRHPGSAGMIQTIESYADQFESAKVT